MFFWKWCTAGSCRWLGLWYATFMQLCWWVGGQGGHCDRERLRTPIASSGGERWTEGVAMYDGKVNLEHEIPSLATWASGRFKLCFTAETVWEIILQFLFNHHTATTYFLGIIVVCWNCSLWSLWILQKVFQLSSLGISGFGLEVSICYYICHVFTWLVVWPKCLVLCAPSMHFLIYLCIPLVCLILFLFFLDSHQIM